MEACKFAVGDIGTVFISRPPFPRAVRARQCVRAGASCQVPGACDRRPRRGRCPGITCRSWQEAVSESGQTYYWNTATMETSWELPSALKQSAQPNEVSSTDPQPDGGGSPSHPDMLQRLSTALEDDPTGVQFSEEARSLRPFGIFDDAFFDFLTASIRSASGEAQRMKIEQLRARLCNPLLRQAAPYE